MQELVGTALTRGQVVVLRDILMCDLLVQAEVFREALGESMMDARTCAHRIVEVVGILDAVGWEVDTTPCGG